MSNQNLENPYDPPRSAEQSPLSAASIMPADKSSLDTFRSVLQESSTKSIGQVDPALKRLFDGKNGFQIGEQAGENKDVNKRSQTGEAGDKNVQVAANDGEKRIARGDKGNDTPAPSEKVKEARDRLKESLEGHLDEPRMARLEAHLKQFEKRAQERVEAQTAGGMDQSKAHEEWDKKIAKTYENLAQMLSKDAPNAVYDLNTRVQLVETMAGQIARPTEFHDQGNNGCGWQMAGVNLGVTQHPDKMSGMLSQVSTTGKFTDTNGKTWDIPRQILRFDAEASKWTMSKSLGDRSRNPVSQILVASAAFLSEDGKRLDKGNEGGTMEKCMHAMKLITGDTWKGSGLNDFSSEKNKQELLMKGGIVLFSPGQMDCGKLEKINNQWALVQDKHWGKNFDKVIGSVDIKTWKPLEKGQYKSDMPSYPKVTETPIRPSAR